MNRRTTFLALCATFALALPAAAQQATSEAATPQPESVVRVQPANNLAPVTLEAPSTETASATSVAMQPVMTRRSSTALMIVGGAAMVAGALVGGDAGNVIMVGGAVIGLVGLYNYLR